MLSLTFIPVDSVNAAKKLILLITLVMAISKQSSIVVSKKSQ